MKLLKVFGLFVLLHLIGWAIAHTIKSNNPDEVLIVIDTSNSMQPHFPEMKAWLEDFQTSARYKKIMVGTDKADLGELSKYKSKEALFRTVFGRMTPENLSRYANSSANEKILLSDGTIKAPGWSVVTF